MSPVEWGEMQIISLEYKLSVFVLLTLIWWNLTIIIIMYK